MDDTNRIRDERIKKLDALRAQGTNAFANGFLPDASCADVHNTHQATPAPTMDVLAKDGKVWTVAGRVLAKNDMGKAAFLRMRDRSVGLDDAEDSTEPQNLQIYVRKDVVTEADWTSWRPADLKPYVQAALEAFGPDRCMYGSDWPVCLLAAPYPSVIAALRESLGTLSDAEREKIFGGTAAKFYGL